MDNTFKFCFSLLVALRVRKCVSVFQIINLYTGLVTCGSKLVMLRIAFLLRILLFLKLHLTRKELIISENKRKPKRKKVVTTPN